MNAKQLSAKLDLANRLTWARLNAEDYDAIAGRPTYREPEQAAYAYAMRYVL